MSKYDEFDLDIQNVKTPDSGKIQTYGLKDVLKTLISTTTSKSACHRSQCPPC